MSIDYRELADSFIEPDICACVLMGSRARKDNGRFSDIDILMICDSAHEKPSHESVKNVLMDNMLASISTRTQEEIESWFQNPVLATETIQGLRDAKILYDPKGIFHAIQGKANNFRWSEQLQEKANDFAGEQLVGWAEEVYKGIEGIIRDDHGRLLNARFGLSWGLAGIMRVYKGLLVTSDNTFLSQLLNAKDIDISWRANLRNAFGISDEGISLTLSDQVIHGLKLYAQTYEIIKKAIKEKHREIVIHTVGLIEEFLTN